jgi:ATP-dependent RNA helicase DDX60
MAPPGVVRDDRDSGISDDDDLPSDFMDASDYTDSSESADEDEPDDENGTDEPEESLENLDAVFGWYSHLHSRRVDIVGDYAGNELFLIEGDSILLECFGNKQLDFDPGFQLLHAVYAVENFLRGLVARRCNFHIAFFDCHSELCIPSISTSTETREKYLLARSIIIRHLRKNLAVHSDIQVHVFPSILSDSFAAYLKETDLYFFMCHDGASSSVLEKRQALGNVLNTLEEEQLKGHESQTKAIFRKVIYCFVQSGYSAALVNGIEWRDTKVVTTILESSRRFESEVSIEVSFSTFHCPQNLL